MHSGSDWDQRPNPYSNNPQPSYGSYAAHGWPAPPPGVEHTHHSPPSAPSLYPGVSHSYSYSPPLPPAQYPSFGSFSSSDYGSSHHGNASFHPPPEISAYPPLNSPYHTHNSSFYPPTSSHDPAPADPSRPHYPSYPSVAYPPLCEPFSGSDIQSLPHVSASYTAPYPPEVDPHYPPQGLDYSQGTTPYPHLSQPESSLFQTENGYGIPFNTQSYGGLSTAQHQSAGQHNDFGSWSSPHSASLPHISHFESCSSDHCIFPHDMASTPSGNGAGVPYSGKLDEELPSKRSLKYALLYGTLDVWIHSATGLPNMDMFSESLRQCLTIFDPCKKPFVKAEQHISSHRRRKITSDPYVCVVLKDATVARTRVISNDQDPEWNEHFTIPVAHTVAEVEFVVKDNDMLGAQFIGEAKIPAESLLTDDLEQRQFDLLLKDGKPCKPGAQLKISLQFRPVEKDPLYKDGVGTGPDYTGVPQTYFPLRKGGRLTLYRDADISENSLPEIELDGGMRFEHRRCWEDICTAILEAHHLIYIAGWSIYTKTKLVRNRDRPLPEPAYNNLGELLKYKSRELVRVLLLVWDDKTSHSVINNEGVMATHDEETRRFFKHSSVHCVLAPRYADSKLSWVKQKVVGTLYTHHQKLVIVDTQGPGNFRKLTAFIGGLDLCDGRYDTPEHMLFRNLDTVFKDDYHNPTFTATADSGGPRQPWHDLHCKIEGPAVYDVLTNFEQRWRKATRWREFGRNFKKVTRWHDDSLADLEHVSWILSPKKDTVHGSYQKNDPLRVTEENDPETWHVQVFRSIDSGSVKGFPKVVVEAEKQNLVCGKNIAVDMSIHRAYIKAIRSAQHFIYIENQYFLGSSFAWPKYKHAGANHLVPIELALKIVSKIRAKERFAVYVVIPMWPEGPPDSKSVQEILYFQSQTMEMMYTLIAEALKEADLAEKFHPTDYLNFFCLGNREVKGEDERPPKIPPAEGSIQAQVQKTRRFMIYVHAKGMVVDDEYFIVGSANINQRSMDGSRDTEIAMGAYQPHQSWARKRAHPLGQIHGYRMSLWAEHLGFLEKCFMEPWSLACVQRVKTIANENWKQYTDVEITEMKGHLLTYPVKVESNGKVVALPDWECFPDVGGRILGTATTLPDTLTT